MNISIITINYNNRQGLQQTLDSVRQQTVQPFEYIVIDGASTDGSEQLLDQYKDIITFGISEKDTGIYNAMNKGVQHAHGDYCLFVNSGDYLYNSRVVESLCSIPAGEDFYIGRICHTESGELSEPVPMLTFRQFFTKSIPHPSTLIRRELLIDNPYDESLRIVSDWKFFVEELIVKNRTYKFVDNIVTYFLPDGISGKNKELCAKERKQVFDKYIPERIFIDYYQAINGNYDPNNEYDAFFAELKKYNLRKAIYSMSVILMRGLSYFKNSARFARRFPLKLRD